MAGINVWELAQYNKQKEYDRFPTTEHIKVHSDKRSTDHNENAICVMFHKFSDSTTLEVRGFDEEGNRFSYKFEYGPVQPVAMRAVNGHGDVEKLNVSTEKNSSGITLRRHKQQDKETTNV